MKITELPLAGAYLVEFERNADARGFFARTFCTSEFEQHGLCQQFIQHSISVSKVAGTIRGVHYQIPPNDEVKLIRVSRGAIFDVLVDVRPSSKNFGKWTTVHLDSHNLKAVYIPVGFAHGLQTLEPDTEVIYMMSNKFDGAMARGLTYRDPELAIPWPLPVTQLSQKDSVSPTLAQARLELERVFK